MDIIIVRGEIPAGSLSNDKEGQLYDADTYGTITERTPLLPGRSQRRWSLVRSIEDSPVRGSSRRSFPVFCCFKVGMVIGLIVGGYGIASGIVIKRIQVWDDSAKRAQLIYYAIGGIGLGISALCCIMATIQSCRNGRETGR